MSLPVAIRASVPSDEPAIYAHWINCLANQRPFSKLDTNWFSAAQHALVERLLSRCRVLVACDPEDANQLYGFVVVGWRQRVLYWVYVKLDFRRGAVATRLMRKAFENLGEIPIEYTTRTRAILYHQERWRLEYQSHYLCEESWRLKEAS